MSRPMRGGRAFWCCMCMFIIPPSGWDRFAAAGPGTVGVWCHLCVRSTNTIWDHADWAAHRPDGFATLGSAGHQSYLNVPCYVRAAEDPSTDTAPIHHRVRTAPLHMPAHTHTQTPRRIHAHSLAHTRTHTHTHTRPTHTQKHAQAHRHTSTHAHTPTSINNRSGLRWRWHSKRGCSSSGDEVAEGALIRWWSTLHVGCLWARGS